MRNLAARVSTSVAMAFVPILLDSACAGRPQFNEYDEQANSQARSAPFVVVGVAGSDIRIGGPVPSRHDPNYPMQLHRVDVQVENVLRGSIDERKISVYYFGFAGGFDGPRPSGFGREPSRRILWLRKERGEFRMACDGWDHCTMFVESGAHPEYGGDPQQPLDQAVADILLTRGEGEIDNLRFASQIQWGLPDQGIQDHVLEKLSYLALTEVSDVRVSACYQLWIYTQDRIGRGLRQRAQASLDAAKCDCRPMPDALPCK